MRAYDFITEDQDVGDQYASVVTVLSLIQDQIKEGKLKPEMPLQFVIRLIRNTGLSTFSAQDLKDANSQVPAIQNIVKQITDDKIMFVTDSSMPVTNTPDFDPGAVDNPQQTVSNMAKSAMKRRQK